MKDGSALTKEQLLAQIEDIIRTMPQRPAILQPEPEGIAWVGRASAAIENWDLVKVVSVQAYVLDIYSGQFPRSSNGLNKLLALIHQARHDLLMQIPGAGNVAIAKGGVFNY